MGVSNILHNLKKSEIKGIHFRNMKNGVILRSYHSLEEVETSEFYEKNTAGYVIAYGHAIIDVM